jgi:hypothetical protein
MVSWSPTRRSVPSQEAGSAGPIRHGLHRTSAANPAPIPSRPLTPASPLACLNLCPDPLAPAVPEEECATHACPYPGP